MELTNIVSKIKFSILTAAFSIYVCLPNHSFAHSWMAPAEEASKKNPVTGSAKSVERGRAIYQNQCEYCHGDGAKGLSKMETGLTKNTPNLLKRLKSHSDGDFHWKILNGKGDMPSFKNDLSENEIWDIINYIKRP